MTAHQETARRVAGVFFAAWLLLALAIADFPPPPGFVILALVLLACALLVFLRIPVYLRWRAEGAKGRLFRVARDGLLGGVTAGVILHLNGRFESVGEKRARRRA